MACQGCGRNANSKLCCPTCIEFGRTSFFCSQECFTKNWKPHNQLHELLRKKRDLSDDTAINSSNGVSEDICGVLGDPGPGLEPEASINSKPRASGGGTTGSSASSSASSYSTAAAAEVGLRRGGGGGGGEFSPLPGGTPLVTNLLPADARRAAEARAGGGAGAAAGRAGERRGAAERRAAADPQRQGGVLGSMAGRVWAMVRRPGDAAGGAASALPTAAARRNAAAAAAAAAASTQPGRSGGVRPGGAAGRSAVPAVSLRTRRFAMHGLVWVLALFAFAASFSYWREFQRYGFERQPADQVLADVGGIVLGPRDASAGEEGLEPPPPGGAGTGDVDGAPSASARGGAGAQTDGGGGATLADLKSEMARLREIVERHDKMLRYVMDRYVEKRFSTSDIGGAGGNVNRESVPVDAREASVVNFAAPEFNSRSDWGNVPDVRPGDGEVRRKRKGGGEALGGEDADAAAAAALSQVAVPPQREAPPPAGAPQPLGSAGAVVSKETGQGQLGI